MAKPNSLCQKMSLILLLFCVLCFNSGFAEIQDGENGYNTVQPLPDFERVCKGTSVAFSQSMNAHSRVITMRKEYTNCTYLVGNLELVFMDEPGVDYDLSFLKTIREITGYVLIAGNKIEYIPLENLRIIRANKPYYHNQNMDEPYALFISINNSPANDTGLKELRFTNLSEILNGRVYFQQNNFLCYENTINWQDINPGIEPPVKVNNKKMIPRKKCGECHESCYSPITGLRHCWGAGPNMCQTLTHVGCHPNCGDGRCYGSAPNQCCHPECAGGCTGPRRTDCFACRNMRDDDGCVPHCSRTTIYDHSTLTWVKNPKAKYSFGSMCVKQCPQYMLQDNGFCVNSCSENKYAKDGRNCEKCNGPCPLRCRGPSDFLNAENIQTMVNCTTIEGSLKIIGVSVDGGLYAPEVVNANNLKNFEGCTSINGNLLILEHTFNGDKHNDIEPLHASNLSVLNSVKEITGSLMIQSSNKAFEDLSFLSNLEAIHGRITPNEKEALSIVATKLKSLELKSLKHIRNGNVLIMSNNELCYVGNINWTLLLSHSNQKLSLHYNKDPSECVAEGEVCHPQCGVSGCWGKGPDKCIKCANYEYEEKGLCLDKCYDLPLLYHLDNGKCAKCHEECANSCTGPENTQCDSCVHVIMRSKSNVDQCVKECGDVMYKDSFNICQRCHPFCGLHACTGPSKFVGKGGCNKCEVGSKENDNQQITCMDPDTVNCLSGYYMSYVSMTHTKRNPLTDGLYGDDNLPLVRQLCTRCHDLCLNCTGSNTEFCSECRYFRSGKHCVRSCPNLYYGNPTTKQCEECHPECRGGCQGPTTFNCTACSNFKIYYEPESSKFNCTSHCPHDMPYLVRDKEDDENRIMCADRSHPEVQALEQKDASEEKKKLIIILCSTIPAALFLLALVACIGFFCFRRAQDNKKAAEYTAKMTGYEEMEPLTPTSAKPDLAKMRLINESELRRGNIIGSGAFGTVYKGIWIPAGENVKIPVAIKVLSEETSPGQSTELLNEARVMCSVEHSCCVRILAVCMSSQIMLITQLMPHGCLLEYVRANKSHIGSKVLLDWCTQIAKGMAYLEERSVVHRDLAARNVLVQTPNQVKITDFGLAKLLDNEAEEYHATGGLMPIKWLALECIQHRIFTHKSDVWSYGVTAWELFTYGKKPYDGIRTRDVPMMLEKGERLQQPMICTIDVYMIMVKCWMLESDSRPSFKELAEEFAKMSRDPGRYLVIEGDEFRKFPESCFTGSELDLGPIDGIPLIPTSASAAEGDSLMRPQNVNFKKEELVRGMSEVPGDIMDAEEYLQPSMTSDYPNQRSCVSGSPPHPPVFDRQSSRSPMSPTPLIAISEQQAYNFDSPHSTHKGHGFSEGPKVRERKYGHLQSAARAKQERQQPRSREDSVSSRYTSDPIKFSKEKGELDWPLRSKFDHGDETPRTHHASPTDGQGKMSPVQLPLDEDNYLQPQAACAYMDLSSKGYYQNEKAFGSTQAEPVLAELERSESRSSDRSRHNSVRSRLDSTRSKNDSVSSQTSPTYDSNYSSNHHPHHKHNRSTSSPPNSHNVSVANPEYFDGLEIDYEEDDVWEKKKTNNWNGYNGYQPVPNGPESPLHSPMTTSPKENGYSYYNDMGTDANGSLLLKSSTNGSLSNGDSGNGNANSNTLPFVNTRASIPTGRHASESLV